MLFGYLCALHIVVHVYHYIKYIVLVQWEIVSNIRTKNILNNNIAGIHDLLKFPEKTCVKCVSILIDQKATYCSLL